MLTRDALGSAGEPILKVNACAKTRTKSDQPVGHPKGALYPTEPQNRYQPGLRKGPKGKGKGKALIDEEEKIVQERSVGAHYTSQFGVHQIERTVSVPLRPNACHRDIPVTLWPNHAKPGAKQYDKGEFPYIVHTVCVTKQTIYLSAYSLLWARWRQ